VTVFEDFPGAGEQGDGVLQFPKDLPENLLQFLEGGMRDVFFVKALVGEVKLLPKGGAVERGFAVSGENTVGGLKNRGEVVHQGAGPVKNQIPNHELSVLVNVSPERGVSNGKV
jgi:hypothetical protein